MPVRPSRQWSFRTRLAVTITAVFIGAGAALLFVEYVAVSRLFDSAISGGQAGLAADGAVAVAAVPAGPASPVAGTTTRAGTELLQVPSGNGGTMTVTTVDGLTVSSWFAGRSESLAGEVRTGLLIWSGVVLAVFAALAVHLSYWLARRSMHRIGEVTAMAKDLSTTDLTRRLDLPGPPDEIKELADTIDAMFDRLEAAFSAQDRFVANASHELRTPLTTARTALEIPLAQGRVPGDLQPAVRMALRAGRHSEELIVGLLTLARSGRPGRTEAVDVADVVADTVADLRELLVDNGIDVHLSSTAAAATGDPVMIAQAVRNLVENAVVHNEHGGAVWIDVGPDGLMVENTGAVVDPETIELLGEPFYRPGSRTVAARADGRPGTGLGLSIVISIAHAHGGSLDIAAREGGGLRVVLTLPSPDPARLSVGALC